ncbi:methyltransferase family protein [Elusimicrobiota bacterium]
MKDPSLKAPAILAPPPLIFAGVFLAGCLLHLRFPFHLFAPRVAERAGSMLLMLSGLLAASAAWTMWRAGAAIGFHRADSRLVVRGPFRLTRNPLYLSLALLYAGLSIRLDMPWTLLLLPAALTVMHLGVIRREERYLQMRFGEEYEEYQRRVRRWI